MTWRRRIRTLLRARGFDIVNYPAPDFDDEFRRTLSLVHPYTLASPERVFAVCEAARYIARFHIPGSVVECGVWRGGAMMAAAETLLLAGDDRRELYLFDTFEGMPEPGTSDIRHDGVAATKLLSRDRRSDPDSTWCVADLAEVRAAMGHVNYPAERVHLVPGKVEETIPSEAPATIALLRLDTDWYASTRHELVHLFPRLASGGVLIIDDYGHWAGARRAVDEYLEESGVQLLLQRTDETGRMAVVP